MRDGSRVSSFRPGFLVVAVVAGVLLPAAAWSQALIFTDGFESGDLAAWSAVRETSAGLLTVTPAAALGSPAFGLEVAAGGRAWLESRQPDRESEVFASFLFNPDNWEMLPRARVEILRFHARGGRHHLRLVLGQAGPGLFRINLQVRGNQGGYQTIGGGPVLAGAANRIEVHWRAASAPNATDGSATLFINGELEAREPTLANGRLDVRAIRLGTVAGQTGATRGSYYLDDFASFRTLAP